MCVNELLAVSLLNLGCLRSRKAHFGIEIFALGLWSVDKTCSAVAARQTSFPIAARNSARSRWRIRRWFVRTLEQVVAFLAGTLATTVLIDVVVVVATGRPRVAMKEGGRAWRELDGGTSSSVAARHLILIFYVVIVAIDDAHGVVGAHDRATSTSAMMVDGCHVDGGRGAEENFVGFVVALVDAYELGESSPGERGGAG